MKFLHAYTVMVNGVVIVEAPVVATIIDDEFEPDSWTVGEIRIEGWRRLKDRRGVLIDLVREAVVVDERNELYTAILAQMLTAETHARIDTQWRESKVVAQ